MKKIPQLYSVKQCGIWGTEKNAHREVKIEIIFAGGLIPSVPARLVEQKNKRLDKHIISHCNGSEATKYHSRIFLLNIFPALLSFFTFIQSIELTTE